MNEQQQQHPLLDVLAGNKLLPPMGPPTQDLAELHTTQVWEAQQRDRQRALEREITAGRERGAQHAAALEQERRNAALARARSLEQQEHDQARAAWLESGGYATDFEQQWPDQYLSIQQARVDEMHWRARARIAEYF